VEVVVHVSADVARVLRGQETSTPDAEEVRSTAARWGRRLEPLRTDAGEEAPSFTTFRLEVAGRDDGERAARELTTCRAVRGAYWKPSDELP
jgi:hypothetical protein